MDDPAPRRFRHECSSCSLKWRVVELWTIPAEELLETHDVGMIPWLPLTDFSAPPEEIVQTCRDEIEQRALPEEKANLLAVTQVLTQLRYNDPGLISILGGAQAMIESPLIQELVAARRQEDVLALLEARFGQIPREIQEEVRSVTDEEQITELVLQAGTCPDLASFRLALK